MKGTYKIVLSDGKIHYTKAKDLDEAGDYADTFYPDWVEIRMI